MKHVNVKHPKKKEILEYRRPVGINVVCDLRGPVSAYQLYDVLYTDGSSEVCRGGTLRTYQGFEDLNGTVAQKKEAGRSLRPELEPAMRAAHTLLERVSNACWDLDKPQTKKRAPPRNRTGTSALRKQRSAPLNQKGKKKNAQRRTAT